MHIETEAVIAYIIYLSATEVRDIELALKNLAQPTTVTAQDRKVLGELGRMIASRSSDL